MYFCLIVALNQSHYVIDSSIRFRICQFRIFLLSEASNLIQFCSCSIFFLFIFFFFQLLSFVSFWSHFWYRTILFAIQFCCYIFDSRVAHYCYIFLHLVDILTFVLNQTTQFTWAIHEFLQIDHSFNSLLNNVDWRTIEILTVRSFKSSRIRIHDVAHSFQWIDDVISFQNALNQFRIDTECFRQSKVFQSFLIKSEFIVSSISNNSTFSSMFRLQSSVFRLDTLIRFKTSTIQFEVSINSRFRRNSNSKIRDSIFSSLTFNYSLITNFDLDLNVFRQFIIESNIIDNERRSVNIQADNSQTFLFTQIEEIRRNMSSIISSSIDVNQVLWNDIMIVIIVFVTIFRFVNETISSVNNNISQSIIKFVENVNYFDFDYEDSFDTNQFIVNSKRHNFYRDVFIFIDYLKNLKKTFSDFRMKKLIFICLKRDALTWYNTKLIKIEKNFFREANIERWYVHLVKRFKKRISTALKKLQIEIYIYVDVRRDRKSRSYMQDIFRHVRAANFSSVFYQCIIAWSNLKLDFRA